MKFQKFNETVQQPIEKGKEEMTRHFINEEQETVLKHISLIQCTKNIDSDYSKSQLFIHHISKKSKAFIYLPTIFSSLFYLSRNSFLSEYAAGSCDSCGNLLKRHPFSPVERLPFSGNTHCCQGSVRQQAASYIP